MIDLKAIKARCEAATGGPWEKCKEAGADVVASTDMLIFEICCGVKTHCTPRDNNVDFIAHARKDLPDCIEEIERLRGAIQLASTYFENDEYYKLGKVLEAE